MNDWDHGTVRVVTTTMSNDPARGHVIEQPSFIVHGSFDLFSERWTREATQMTMHALPCQSESTDGQGACYFVQQSRLCDRPIHLPCGEMI